MYQFFVWLFQVVGFTIAMVGVFLSIFFVLSTGLILLGILFDFTRGFFGGTVKRWREVS